MKAGTSILACVLLVTAFPVLGQERSTPATPQASVEASITHGPVVESTTANSAVIAWTTNVSSGTVVQFGTDPDHLNSGSAMPWGGYTHRVTLRNLQPDTTYYFRASSPDAQGSGGTLASPVGTLHTSLGQP